MRGDYITLQFFFFQFPKVKSPKNFTICENCPADQLKAKKIGVTNIVFLLFAILCFLPPSQIWSYEFFD